MNDQETISSLMQKLGELDVRLSPHLRNQVSSLIDLAEKNGVSPGKLSFMILETCQDGKFWTRRIYQKCLDPKEDREGEYNCEFQLALLDFWDYVQKTRDEVPELAQPKGG